MSRETLKIYLPAFVIALLGFAIAYQFVDLAPPARLTIAAGQQGGAYYAYAERYRAFLARRGIEAVIQETAGSIDNIKRLQHSSADVAFVQSGIRAPDELRSLGSVYYEPLWIFLRRDLDTCLLNELRGRRISIGMNGSGTRALALQLLAENGIDAGNSRLESLGNTAAAHALQQGALDALLIVSGPDNASVQSLLRSPDIHLIPIRRAPAYARRIASISTVTLPAGALDLARNTPAADTPLLAVTATLAVREQLHPALQGLLMQAATTIHSGHSLLADAGSFPSPPPLHQHAGQR